MGQPGTQGPPSPPGAKGTCSHRCGDRDGLCSCHPTCSGLNTCCSDFRDFCLEISPYSGSMMGGKDFVVQHLNWFNPTDGVICRWEARGAPCMLGIQGQLAGWVPQGGGQEPRPRRGSAHPGPGFPATSGPPQV